jgi:hypothetical protein
MLTVSMLVMASKRRLAASTLVYCCSAAARYDNTME